NQRRKTLRNNIRPLLSELDQQAQREGRPVRDHAAFLSDPMFGLRPEQLSVQDFVGLTNNVARETGLTS
ncbi:MAG: 16S rRNA (adenine(1518)-N(6)/adenine(1519)-N(6))-dimethyltransferase, partial [Bacteroidaceae bacterium]|nr:16S rRNA (adenine(1518)-N(6)/adenine(1519)-N(6))-dimethyltransferase [Bacteroidaceae bacterium]